MKVLVTGGAGYVGSFCVRLLCERGHHIVVYDNLSAGHSQALPDEVTFVHGDLLDRSALAQVFETHTFDGVMHFAALLNVSESMSQPRRYYENNVLGTLNLVGEMMNHDVRRLVFSSTCAVYGLPEVLPIGEDAPKKPISPYGRTKWVVEQALADCAAADGLGSISLRYFNATGASADGQTGEDHDPEYHLVPVVLQVALGQRQKIQIFGTDYPTPDGTAVRDYIHVEDLASAHLLALQSVQPRQARAYNLGTGEGHSVRQVIDVARHITGCGIHAEEAERRQGDPAELVADSALIQQELGWRPRSSDLENILSSAWNWHKRHPGGYEG